MDEATLWTQEILTTLIEKIITKAFEEQQKNLFSIIKANFEISKQQIAELKKKINELIQRIEHAENVLEDRVACAEEKLGNIESHIIIFWDFSMFYQIFLSPQVKRMAIITYKHGIYKFPHELEFRIRT